MDVETLDLSKLTIDQLKVLKYKAANVLEMKAAEATAERQKKALNNPQTKQLIKDIDQFANACGKQNKFAADIPVTISVTIQSAARPNVIRDCLKCGSNPSFRRKIKARVQVGGNSSRKMKRQIAGQIQREIENACDQILKLIPAANAAKQSYVKQSEALASRAWTILNEANVRSL